MRAAWEKHRAMVGQQRVGVACLLMLVAMGDSETIEGSRVNGQATKQS